MEEWRTVPGLPRYQVSTLGRVSHKGKLMAGSKAFSRREYPRIRFDIDSGNVRIAIHSLVAYTFLGPCPPWLEVNHKDGNKSNPALENLEYITKSDNHKHSYRVLGQRRNTGSKHGMARLSEEHARAILERRSRGETCAALASEFGVSTATVYKIGERRTWKHLDTPIKPLSD
jgi:hypothetical protein